MSLFDNRLAIVFGGARDIGRAVSVDLAKNGAQVAFSYNFVLTIAGAVAPVAAVLLFLVAGPIHRIDLATGNWQTGN